MDQFIEIEDQETGRCLFINLDRLAMARQLASGELRLDLTTGVGVDLTPALGDRTLRRIRRFLNGSKALIMEETKAETVPDQQVAGPQWTDRIPQFASISNGNELRSIQLEELLHEVVVQTRIADANYDGKTGSRQAAASGIIRYVWHLFMSRNYT